MNYRIAYECPECGNEGGLNIEGAEAMPTPEQVAFIDAQNRCLNCASDDKNILMTRLAITSGGWWEKGSESESWCRERARAHFAAMPPLPPADLAVIDSLNDEALGEYLMTHDVSDVWAQLENPS